MGNHDQKNENFYIYAALWGVPGLFTLREAYRLATLPGLRDSFAQGPAGYLSGLGLLLLGFSLWEIFKGLSHRRTKRQSHPSQKSAIPQQVFLGVGNMVLFLVLLPILGFIFANACFLVLCLRLLGCSIRATVFTAGIYCGTLYWILPYLGLSLPRGIFGI